MSLNQSLSLVFFQLQSLLELKISQSLSLAVFVVLSSQVLFSFSQKVLLFLLSDSLQSLSLCFNLFLFSLFLKLPIPLLLQDFLSVPNMLFNASLGCPHVDFRWVM